MIAHIRHTETDYDALLASGLERRPARAQVEGTVLWILARWEAPECPPPMGKPITDSPH
jgi:hypothetical protein